MTDSGHAVRLAQTISPFGVGAIYDVLGESFVACDTALWKSHGTPLKAQRLAEKLHGVAGFRSAPSRASLAGQRRDYGIPFYRFPQWLFCSHCRRMIRWSTNKEVLNQPATCDSCSGARRLVPMRFVAICEQGHLFDVPWVRWAHARAGSHDERQCAKPQLEFTSTRSRGGGLASLVVSCRTCGASSDLGGLTQPGALKRIGARCEDRQPWQARSQSPSCDADPLVVQRGASNAWFARIESAIDIPPYSDFASYSDKALDITNHPAWKTILAAPDGPMVPSLVAMIVQQLDVAETSVRQLLRDELAGDTPPVLAPGADTGTIDIDLLEGEWLALTSPPTDPDDRDHFVARPVGPGEAPDSPAMRGLHSRIRDVVLVTKLREVRALSGFSRVQPGVHTVRPDLGRGLDWLPAVEVHGEGVFIAFDESTIQAWERRSDVRERADLLETRRSQSFYAKILGQSASPRHIMLHTLSHLLMRQLAFESGYSSASLRERLYTHTTADGHGRAGILIYTAAGDVEGTLGGLARLGEPPYLAETVLTSLRAGAWCSADPVCGESTSQGLNGMNLAACHACALVSETSCIQLNSLLDRGLVTGTPEHDIGFFSETVREAFEDTIGVRG